MKSKCICCNDCYSKIKTQLSDTTLTYIQHHSDKHNDTKPNVEQCYKVDDRNYNVYQCRHNTEQYLQNKIKVALTNIFCTKKNYWQWSSWQKKSIMRFSQIINTTEWVVYDIWCFTHSIHQGQIFCFICYVYSSLLYLQRVLCLHRSTSFSSSHSCSIKYLLWSSYSLILLRVNQVSSNLYITTFSTFTLSPVTFNNIPND